MSAGQVAMVIAGVWLVGSGVGAGMFVLLARGIYGRGVLAGQQQAELTHSWHRPVNVGVNPVDVPANRHRSPDDQLVTRTGVPSQPRPGFHDLPS